MKYIEKFLNSLGKNKIFKILKLNFLSSIAWFIIQILNRTLKIYQVNFESIKNLSKNVIYAFFHGEQFVLVYIHRHTKIVIMTSFSEDGELQTKILKKFGYDIVRGSAEKKGAASGTLSIIEKLLKGQNCAFAVDGPHGPAFKVKPGIVFLSQKTKLPIIPVRVFVEKKVQLNNWDRYILPLPFSKVWIVYGKPIYVSEE
ncbi:MAG: lysophospholipid acyltransferase family protein, partial [Endomicrobiia bacterium]